MKMASQGLLVIKGSRTGRGDRIRAVLVGLLYAEVSNRCVYVDWRDGMYGPAGENVLRGAVDDTTVNDPDRWLGGVHLTKENLWRWDGTALRAGLRMKD